MIYKNNSLVQKTFHGVTFKPGDIKEVSGYIHSKGFVRVAEMPKEPPKSVEPKKQVASKQEPSKQEPKNIKKEETVNGKDSDQ